MTTSGSPDPGNYDPQSYGSAGAPGGQTPGSYPPPPPAGNYPPAPGGYGQPGYGQPGHYAPTGYPAGSVGARPGVVTAAGVMSYVIGAFLLLGGIISLFGGGLLISTGSGTGTGVGAIFIVLAIIFIALGALHIWAGKMAMDGKDFRILLVVSAISALMSLIQLFRDFNGSNIISLAIPVIIIVLLLRPEAVAWIKARGGRTFQN